MTTPDLSVQSYGNCEIIPGNFAAETSAFPDPLLVSDHFVDNFAGFGQLVELGN